MPNLCLITGSCGLIGSECALFFAKKGFRIIGIDNNMRAKFFGPQASTITSLHNVSEQLESEYIHHNVDITDFDAVNRVFNGYESDIKLIIHTAAQPSHDYPAKTVGGPHIDFNVNACGTLNLLEATRKYCPDSTFIIVSTNKVYGDRPNTDIPLMELETRYELNSDLLDPMSTYGNVPGVSQAGISEDFGIDQSKHSLFGVSKLAADLYVQEYGRYFGMKTGVFRGGCLTGSGHSSVELHGFLSYLAKCIVRKQNYNIYGYKGKQVRDNIHSYDVANAFWNFHCNPKCGEVYNLGGGRHSNTSMREAISKLELLTGNKAVTTYFDENRVGDHMWYISDMGKFKRDYTGWDYTYDLDNILVDIVENIK